MHLGTYVSMYVCMCVCMPGLRMYTHTNHTVRDRESQTRGGGDERKKDRQTEKQKTELRQKDRQTDRQTDKLTRLTRKKERRAHRPNHAIRVRVITNLYHFVNTVSLAPPRLSLFTPLYRYIRSILAATLITFQPPRPGTCVCSQPYMTHQRNSFLFANFLEIFRFMVHKLDTKAPFHPGS